MKQKDGFFVRILWMEKVFKKMCAMEVQEYDFTPGEIIVLLFLLNNPSLNTARDIAYYKGISKGLVARCVESLCQKGYVKAIQDDTDRRIYQLYLTDESYPITVRLQACKKKFNETMMQGIDEEQRNMFYQTIEQMNENIEKFVEGR